MEKSKRDGRNPLLNPKTHCVMVHFDDVEWNRFLTMYEESLVYAKAVFLKAHFFGQRFKVLKVEKAMMALLYKLEKHIINLMNTEQEDCGASKEEQCQMGTIKTRLVLWPQ